MAIASQLPKTYNVTIVARNLPGDPHVQEWASPWAGAVWSGMDGSNPREQQMQLDALAVWWKLAVTDPDSSVRRVEMTELRDSGSLDQIWYRNKVPDFQVLPPEALPAGAAVGVRYRTIVLTPMTFLPWMRAKLEANGVKFKRATVRSLADLSGLGHDVLINAAGIGPRRLTDVMDQRVQEVRGQTVLVKSDYDRLFIRRGKDYTYVFARQDGTAVLGGIKQFGNVDTKVDSELRADVRRITFLMDDRLSLTSIWIDLPPRPREPPPRLPLRRSKRLHDRPGHRGHPAAEGWRGEGREGDHQWPEGGPCLWHGGGWLRV